MALVAGGIPPPQEATKCFLVRCSTPLGPVVVELQHDELIFVELCEVT